MNKIAVYHPTGNSNVRAVSKAFYSSNKLASLNTTIATDIGSVWFNLLPNSLKSEFLRRSYDVPMSIVHAYPLRELMRLILPKIGFRKLTINSDAIFGIDNVYKSFCRDSAKRLQNMKESDMPDVVYAYEDGALELFEIAKKRGITCVYDLPIAYWETGRRLLLQQAELYPEWQSTLQGVRDTESKLNRKTRELELADVVVGPGKFVMDSIPDWARFKHQIESPFGSPQSTYFNESRFQKSKEGPLRVLFVGSMGQRKGLADLLSAFKGLDNKHVELVIMGSMLAPMSFYKARFPDFIYEQGRPHHKVLELMESCHVLCLPSIVEGRALVMQEAMSRGLPIIITPNTGGEDLVIEGKTGFLVPVNAPDKIAEKIEWFISNRNEVPKMGTYAREHALAYTWDNYGNAIVKQLDALLNQSVSNTNSNIKTV